MYRLFLYFYSLFNPEIIYQIIALEDLFVREKEDELYITMELMDTDLHKIIQSPQGLTEAHFQYFLDQLLHGLKFITMESCIAI